MLSFFQVVRQIGDGTFALARGTRCMIIYASGPLLTERDEVESAEGGIDPLGTEPIAETLGVMLSPGVRERQLHPRFLTAMAVSMWATHST